MPENEFGLPERTINTISQLFSKYPGIREAVVYGSRAKGNYRNGSDIDITLHTSETFTRQDLGRLRGDLEESSIPYMIDISNYRDISNENLKEHIKRVGKPLYRAG